MYKQERELALLIFNFLTDGCTHTWAAHWVITQKPSRGTTIQAANGGSSAHLPSLLATRMEAGLLK